MARRQHGRTGMPAETRGWTQITSGASRVRDILTFPRGHRLSQENAVTPDQLSVIIKEHVRQAACLLQSARLEPHVEPSIVTTHRMDPVDTRYPAGLPGLTVRQDLQVSPRSCMAFTLRRARWWHA